MAFGFFCLFFLMFRRPPRSTRTDTLFPYTTLFRSRIANNGGRLGKTLWTEREAGEKVRVMGVWDGPEEARFVGERIETHIAGGGRAEDCAILVRAQFQDRKSTRLNSSH